MRLRITGGELRGRPLQAGSGVRPTAGRTREAVFSMLGPLEGATVLDLFCGSGSLGIEALSRGAGSAVLVDRDVRACEANVAALELGDRTRVVRGELPRWLATEGQCQPAFDVVCCDPPYRIARRVAAALDEHLPPLLHARSRVVFEGPAGQGGRPALPLLRERRYGDTVVTVHGA
ncbi:MAG: RsmD family RNA methyltransferase [Solirubrobacterales bacterium]